MVPISTFVRESHGKFNERAHGLYAKRAMTSAQERSARNAFKNFDSILVSDLVSSLVSKKVRGLTPLTCALDGGRYKIRTCDPIRVKDMLYP